MHVESYASAQEGGVHKIIIPKKERKNLQNILTLSILWFVEIYVYERASYA